MEKPPAPLSRVVLNILLLLLVLIVLWAFFGKLDIVARAEGKLIPKTRLQVVQPLDGGRVAEIRIEEGELVKKGQILVVMNDSISRADTEQLTDETKSIELQLRRTVAEIEDKKFVRLETDETELYEDIRKQFEENTRSYQIELSQQRSLIEQSEEELASENQLLTKLEETLPIIQASEDAIKNLQKKGFANEMDLMSRERERIEVERDYQAQKFRIRSLVAGLNEAKQRTKQIKATYKQSLLDEKVELEQRSKQLVQELNKQEYRNKLLALESPQDGYVKDLATHTQGSVIPSGTVLLTIVPVDVPLQAEILVENKDAGFIQAGQEAKIKVASFEFQKYGMIQAFVEHVSADSSQQESSNGMPQGVSTYRAILNLEEQTLSYNNKEYDLKPGMQVTAEVNLGTRTVMQYIFSPVTRAVREAGTEH
jgi:membrane fusion protein, hemolysin D